MKEIIIPNSNGFVFAIQIEKHVYELAKPLFQKSVQIDVMNNGIAEFLYNPRNLKDWWKSYFKETRHLKRISCDDPAGEIIRRTYGFRQLSIKDKKEQTS